MLLLPSHSPFSGSVWVEVSLFRYTCMYGNGVQSQGKKRHHQRKIGHEKNNGTLIIITKIMTMRKKLLLDREYRIF